MITRVPRMDARCSASLFRSPTMPVRDGSRSQCWSAAGQMRRTVSFGVPLYWWPMTGRFLGKGRDGMHRVIGGSKEDDVTNIGTPGIGLKSACHICEALLYIGAGPSTWLAGGLIPWAGTGEDEQADPLYPDWEEVGESAPVVTHPGRPELAAAPPASPGAVGRSADPGTSTEEEQGAGWILRGVVRVSPRLRRRTGKPPPRSGALRRGPPRRRPSSRTHAVSDPPPRRMPARGPGGGGGKRPPAPRLRLRAPKAACPSRRAGLRTHRGRGADRSRTGGAAPGSATPGHLLPGRARSLSVAHHDEPRGAGCHALDLARGLPHDRTGDQADQHPGLRPPHLGCGRGRLSRSAHRTTWGSPWPGSQTSPERTGEMVGSGPRWVRHEAARRVGARIQCGGSVAAQILPFSTSASKPVLQVQRKREQADVAGRHPGRHGPATVQLVAGGMATEPVQNRAVLEIRELRPPRLRT